MDLMNQKLSFTAALLILAVTLVFCPAHAAAQNLQLQNDQLLLEFDRDDGTLIRIQDLVHSENLTAENILSGSPWEIYFPGTEDKSINADDASSFSFSKPAPSQLVLTWQNFSGSQDDNLIVTVTVNIDKNKPISTWNISLTGIRGSKIHKVVFPKIEAVRNLGNEYLAAPVWMGQLLENPRNSLASRPREERIYEWEYPGVLSMQFIALYNPKGIGLYAASNDSLSYRKSFSVSLDSLDQLTYQMTNFPAVDSTMKSYSLKYEGIIGSFKGDWITAAEQYRDWGSKQRWSKESRLKKDLTPSWLENTALWVWNREESENVLKPAVELKKKLGLPVSVLWHWWHEGQYDVSFPEYFPPREGSKSFKSAVSSAKARGVHSIVYMNQLQWGTSTKSFETENASAYAVKNMDGDMISHAYNIFTGKSLTNMCIATQFWKDKYASLAEKAINTYGVSGIYMDQACLSRMCYDKNHNHPIGGGNYWPENSTQLTEQIRAGIPPQKQIVLAGEGGLESYLPYLDVFLTLQVSRERYAGIGDWKTIPLFQSVYHEYGITFGSYSSLLSPPYDDTWPAEYAPENEQSLLDEDFNKQFLMEQARSFVWGMQPTIANYKSILESERKEEIEYLRKLATVRHKGLKYLLHGKFVRTPSIEFPTEQINISRLSIYAGRGNDRVTTSKGRFPMIYAGSWKAGDNSMAIALASISDKNFTVDFSFNAGEYQLASSGEIFVIAADNKRHLAAYSEGVVEVEFELPPKGIYMIEIIPDG